MATYLLDTNHLSSIVTENHLVRRRIHQQLRFGDSFFVAVPTLTETLFGIQQLPRAKHNLQEWRRAEVMFTFCEIEKVDAEFAATLQLQLRQRGWQLATVDALIASIALRYSLTLLTTDHDFNVVPGLLIENWF